MKYKAGRQTKQLFPFLNTKAAKTSLALSRIKLGRFVRPVSSHNNLNYHMSLCNPGHTYKCRFCNLVVESFFHFCTMFPAFTQTHSHYFLHYDNVSIQPRDHESILPSLIFQPSTMRLNSTLPLGRTPGVTNLDQTSLSYHQIASSMNGE